MKKHSFSGGGNAGNVNKAGAVSGNANARHYISNPVSNPTTSGGAYDDNGNALNGPSGVAPKGNQFSRMFTVSPGEFNNNIGHAQPLKTSGKANDILGETTSGQSYNVIRPKRKGRTL